MVSCESIPLTKRTGFVSVKTKAVVNSVRFLFTMHDRQISRRNTMAERT